MIALSQDQHDALRQIVAAGADGLLLAEVGAAMAIRLGIERFVVITAGDLAPQRVIATRNGASHLRRAVFA